MGVLFSFLRSITRYRMYGINKRRQARRSAIHVPAAATSGGGGVTSDKTSTTAIGRMRGAEMCLEFFQWSRSPLLMMFLVTLSLSRIRNRISIGDAHRDRTSLSSLQSTSS